MQEPNALGIYGTLQPLASVMHNNGFRQQVACLVTCDSVLACSHGIAIISISVGSCLATVMHHNGLRRQVACLVICDRLLACGLGTAIITLSVGNGLATSTKAAVGLMIINEDGIQLAADEVCYKPLVRSILISKCQHSIFVSTDLHNWNVLGRIAFKPALHTAANSGPIKTTELVHHTPRLLDATTKLFCVCLGHDAMLLVSKA
mmetsp:Transcript_7695/g.28187  ORF Transcript_7695/g.28187 Transcript_7695/m.28187 type:complete len:205 (-) Transcript_7695:173-787(-)|eukprot:CAMPEP_0203881666 /NCGR_PEP_ID=MMETSP0359-20131031/25946_1 /ASSEMBLY_ACC=CAM_ASM_000338 /TAXON_ID=268821 /ORGANISM="Scrippsiella Hangoei, Strain SHTV-5" /LENGTH=204 /DNA_ID=CAMNT_0050801539 /DNA_START=325 /DNA_END=939 /DNA_ORIENTATION=-